MSGIDRISLRKLMKASLQGLWCVVNLRSQHGSEAAEDGREKKIPKIMASSPPTSWLIEGGKWEAVTDFTSFACKITSDSDCGHKIKAFALGKESYGKSREHFKKQRCHFADKALYSQSFDFSNSHTWMWELDHKKGWALKNWCFWIVMLEKTLENPLDFKVIKPVNPKGNQPWIFTGRTDAEAEALILWPPDGKSQLIGKYPDAGKDWGQWVNRAT